MYTYMYIYMCVCMCVYIYVCIYIIYLYLQRPPFTYSATKSWQRLADAGPALDVFRSPSPPYCIYLIGLRLPCAPKYTEAAFL